MFYRHTLFAALAAACLQGCVAKAAFDVVTLPVKAAGKAVDLATTSQSEADEARGRDLRRREQRLGELERDWRRADERCKSGNQRECVKRLELGEEIAELLPTIPYEPEQR